ncbi:MAG: hypothetical protein LKM44_01365 [Wolbachia endosymbiont of Meromenopon meropis]|nr:hypothetical protein [Wolbachia endosymbiont of Meromenopon meropis]
MISQICLKLENSRFNGINVNTNKNIVQQEKYFLSNQKTALRRSNKKNT